MTDPLTPDSLSKRTGREHALWGYRLFLDREPESEEALLRSASNTAELRQGFLTSSEFQANNPDLSLCIDKWVIVQTILGFRLFVALNEFGVSRPVLLDNYEWPAVRLFESLVTRGDRVIDIGANIGFHTMWLGTLVGPNGRVIAFEPVEYLYKALVDSVKENGFENRCLTYRCALSDQPGAGLIRHAEGTTNFGGAHLTAIKQNDDHAYDPIELRVLRDFLSEQPCKLIKLDVEGAEMKVLKGGLSLLQKDRPAVFAEIFNDQLRNVSESNGTEMIRFMATQGYRCFDLAEGKVGTEITSYDSDEIINVIFLHG